MQITIHGCTFTFCILHCLTRTSNHVDRDGLVIQNVFRESLECTYKAIYLRCVDRRIFEKDDVSITKMLPYKPAWKISIILSKENFGVPQPWLTAAPSPDPTIHTRCNMLYIFIPTITFIVLGEWIQWMEWCRLSC